MPEGNFTVRVDDDLKAAFTEAAKRQDRTGAQLVREFMRDYVQHARADQAYEDWFRKKVETGRAAMRSGQVLSHDAVEVQFKEKRAAALRQAGRSDR